MIVIANLFSFIGCFLLAYSTFSKSKKNMLIIQVGDCMFNSLGCLFARSLSGFTTNFICGVRNIVNAKERNNKCINFVFIILIIVLGVVINTRGILGLLPIIASVEYTIWSYLCKTAQGLRFGLVLNLVLWLIHDCSVSLFTSATLDVILICITVYNIIKNDGDNRLEKS